MRFLSAAHTDVGITKKINQDAFCLKIAKTSEANIAFAVMCDGMGGLRHGELASSFVVNAFSAWFENVFPNLMTKKIDMTKVTEQWNSLVLEQGRKIREYGASRNYTMGTTVSALLIVNDEYAIIHVGDSRVYQINTQMRQLTKDHTVVAYAIENKQMTPEQAQMDSRRNTLTQCVGASAKIAPEIRTGKLAVDDEFLLCSDGFRHQISEEEFFGVLAPGLMTSERVMKNALSDLIELNKSRKETDNITAILIKAIR